jgi:hypothetical protein
MAHLRTDVSEKPVASIRMEGIRELGMMLAITSDYQLAPIPLILSTLVMDALKRRSYKNHTA